MAGGTGGHVFPGIAVADYMRSLGWRVVWLGTQSGMEAVLVSRYGYPMEYINFSGIRRKSIMDWLLLPGKLLLAFWQSIKILKRIQPNIVLGMGGYPAFPGGLMAILLNKPLVIHEQNAIAGLSNKVLARVADKILLGFPGTFPQEDNRVIVTGNPVRSEIASLPLPEQRFLNRTGPIKILVIGGSLGASVLNKVVPQALGLIPEDRRPVVKHQAGKKHIDELKENYREQGVEGQLIDFIDDMATSYAECDLVICRAGALTISELATVGVASILVPFPYAVDDHQTANAGYLSKPGAAVLLPQYELTPDNLAKIIMELTRAQLLVMAKLARNLASLDAANQVAQICIAMEKSNNEA
ncbi:MAG: undecaprenyldiphospho-muramoylpentapeptide beta-N-acetylglucosaminyltransferase [Nitrosomonas sp.]|nr:undecaprenyldiphospho-muramoylpentapeptide beta-N-acetylglucosaminyltransferase [Nitrosomonas sp.]MBK7363806.1 undecaprenyldiphospho-muramoylpentapeptide beta-N-acetylglucosaminyltransferase [Nitrosomonas sp.]